MTVRIISGSVRETDQYAQARALSDYEHVASSDQLRGVPKGSRVVLTGNYFKNPISNNLSKFPINYVQEPIVPEPKAPTNERRPVANTQDAYTGKDTTAPTPQQVQEYRRAEARKRLLEEAPEPTQDGETPIWNDLQGRESEEFIDRAEEASNIMERHTKIAEVVNSCFVEATRGMNFSYQDAQKLVFLEHAIIQSVVKALS